MPVTQTSNAAQINSAEEDLEYLDDVLARHCNPIPTNATIEDYRKVRYMALATV